MSNAIEAMKTRRSVRSYKSDSVPAELIEKIAEAGSWAPTGMGMQSPIIIAVTNKELRNKISKMNAAIMGKDESFDPFFGAPAILIVLAEKSRPTAVYDGCLVMGNMMLAAHELGLGSCWIHRAKEEFETPEGKEILSSLGIEGDYIGIGHCAVGYIDGQYPEPKPRKENYVYYVK